MPQLPKLTTREALRTIAALKREASECADRMNQIWQELDDLESRIENEREEAIA